MDLRKMTDEELCNEIKRIISENSSRDLEYGQDGMEKIALELFNTNKELGPYNAEVLRRKMDIRKCLKND